MNQTIQEVAVNRVATLAQSFYAATAATLRTFAVPWVVAAGVPLAEDPMKRRTGLSLVVVALVVSALAYAGGDKKMEKKCTASTQECLDKMAASLPNKGLVGVEGDWNDEAGSYTAPLIPWWRVCDPGTPSFLDHLKVLEKAGMVRSRKTGRVRTYQLAPRRMRAAEDWLSRQRTMWEQRFDQFDSYVMALKEKDRS